MSKRNFQHQYCLWNNLRGLTTSEHIYQLVWTAWCCRSSVWDYKMGKVCVSLQLCWVLSPFNTLRPRQNGRHFADDIFKCILLNENVLLPIKISLKFVPKCPINNISTLVQIMAWRRPGDKPLSELMMVSLRMHICVTRPQWVNNIGRLQLRGCTV